MPANRNALIRYKTIDKCLQNRYRKWTLNDLIDACSDALYEYEGIDKGVSRRTVQSDIQTMRSDKLGYNAPIIVLDKKYYTYEEADYSITNIPITEQDLEQLGEAVAFMKQFKGFSHFKELDSMVQKLEDHVYAQQSKRAPIIDFEKNEQLKGIEHLDYLYQAILKEQSLIIDYKSFKARKANQFTFFPYLLKEFRNRWFLIGKTNENPQIYNLALDRILELNKSEVLYKKDTSFDASSYYKDSIGASVNRGEAIVPVEFSVARSFAPYVETKPLHHSQECLKKDAWGSVFRIHVRPNKELEKELLALGDKVRVIGPPRLKRIIQQELKSAYENYEGDVNDKGLKNAGNKLRHQGYCLFSAPYSTRQLKNISNLTDRMFAQQASTVDILPNIVKNKHYFEQIFQRKVYYLLQNLLPDSLLVRASFQYHLPEKKPTDSWEQGGYIEVKTQAEHAGFSQWKALENGGFRVLPDASIRKRLYSVTIFFADVTVDKGPMRFLTGSHKNALSPKEIELVHTNSYSKNLEINQKNMLIQHSLLLQKTSPPKALNTKRPVLTLDFLTGEVPEDIDFKNSLTWSTFPR